MKKLCFLFILFTASINCSMAQIELWGMMSSGSVYGGGNIFKIGTSGSGFSVVKDFYRTDGLKPTKTKLLEAPDGKLYGMTYNGGYYDQGVIFQYDPATNVYTKKYDFDGISHGGNPSGSLMLASDGKMYGMTTNGGTNALGVIFQYDYVTNTYTKKLDFNGTVNGSHSMSSLMQASDGKLYGMTKEGGGSDKGVIFQYDPVTNTYVKKMDFNGAANGTNPNGDLMQAADGKLYGMTCFGGSNNNGVLFYYDPVTDIYTKKLDLSQSGGGGSNPAGGLLEASDGNLYGVTSAGGTNNKGVLFQYVPSTGVYTKKWDFTVSLATDGASPVCSLIQASDGNLYGMASAGGVGNTGCLFKYTLATGNYSLMLNGFGGVNGKCPLGSLMQASDGKLYGMTYIGGSAATGVLFQYDLNTNTYVKKLNLGGDDIDGSKPVSSLIKAANGKLYGMTNTGGIFSSGVIFEYDPVTAIYTKKFDFGGNDGSAPLGSLMQATDGNLYGMTYSGGLGGNGVLFQYDPVTDIYTVKVNFNGTNGATPYSSLIQASNGKLYGVTSAGGSSGWGVLFEYDPVANSYAMKIDFTSTINGTMPMGSLVQAADGKLYGLANFGGAYNSGALFQYDPLTGIYTKKFDFNPGVSGNTLRGSLFQATDGKLYGTTQIGGANTVGVLFQYDYLTNTFTKKMDFNNTTGSFPLGDLMQASDGKLYGTTMGTLYQYDIFTNTYSTKYIFDGIHGSQPQNITLLEMTGSVITGASTLNSLTVENLVSIAPNPAQDMLTIQFNGKVSSELTIKVMDVLGKEMLSVRMNENQAKSISLDNFKSGLYFIEIQNGKDRTVKKFIKE